MLEKALQILQMKTLLKWPGGKESELPVIRQYMPEFSGRYIEPFVGGGAAFFDTDARMSCINDRSRELINLYRCVQKQDKDFAECIRSFSGEFTSLGQLVDNSRENLLRLYTGGLSIDSFIESNKSMFSKMARLDNSCFISELRRNLSGKLKRSHRLEETRGPLPNKDRIDNLEAALKSAYYMYVRHLLNTSESFSPGVQAAVFFFVREFCYSSMFRYNSRGEFNVPYGGISYNNKDIQKKVDYLLGEIVRKLENTLICCKDFEEFITSLKPTREDFIFLDPPYDTDFSSYSGNEFGQSEHIRLCECLKRTPARILLVIKNTDFIYDLYKDGFNIKYFDKKYAVSFKNRNSRDVRHLIITKA